MNANADNHADNAEQPQNALQSLNGLIFDLGDTIPEGIYLEMMNHTKQIFNDMKKLKEATKTIINPMETIEGRVNYTLNGEDKLFKLRRVVKDRYEGEDILKFYQEDSLLFNIRSLKLYQLMRIYENGNDYKFIRITKINEKSFKYDIIKIYCNGSITIRKNKILKFREGEFVEDLRRKNILFYDTPNMRTSRLYSKLTEGRAEGEFIEEQYLRIEL